MITMTYHSENNHSHDEKYIFQKEVIRPHDIFYGEHFNYTGEKMGHYFYCVHSQEEDVNNGLFRDIIGLLITTKKPLGYFCEIEINNKAAYVCCDKQVRFISETGKVQLKHYRPTREEKKKVFKCLRDFEREKFRQMKRGL